MRRFIVLLVLVLVACSGTDQVDRDVVIETVGCGDAFDGGGRGIDIGGGLVVTAAHVVAQAERVLVGGIPGDVVAFDDRTDLALVRVETDLPAIRFAAASVGTTGTILGLPGSVVRRADIRIERVLSTERVTRAGYEIAAPLRVGDSGAGFLDADGSLVGVLFAVDSDGGSAWLVSADELAAVLEEPEVGFGCDPARSRLVG